MFTICSLLVGILSLSSYTSVQANEGVFLVDDLLEHRPVNHTWMEIGYANITETEWTTITTTVVDINPDNSRDISVYLSLPEYGGGTAADGWSMVTKMNGRATRTSTGAYTFEARLVQPNETFCPEVYWVYEQSPTIRVGWMLVEEGVYNVTNSMLVFGSGEITRNNSVPRLGDDRVNDFANNKYVMQYPSGCDVEDLDANCAFADHLQPDLGSTNQIQTSINKKPANQELWLNTRIISVGTREITMVLAVHSTLVDDRSKDSLTGPYNFNFTIYADFADIHIPEIVSYFVWRKDLKLECIEGLFMDTAIFDPITHLSSYFDYFYTFDTVPGLFGMIGTIASAADSASLRAFNQSVVGTSFIVQEDQCVDKELIHTNAEAAFAMVVGSAADVLGDTYCFIAYDRKPCDYTIYLYDLFMDGWDNVMLVVESGDDTFNFTTGCGAKSVTFTSEHCTWNAYMQTSDGNAPVTWWENFWRYEHIDTRGDVSGDVYVGDYDSTISVKRDVVTFTDLANTRADAKDNKCEQCKVAPPPPGKGKGADGVGKGADGVGEGAEGDGNGDGDGNGANGGVADLTAGNIALTPPAGVGVAPADGAPAGVLQIIGVSAQNGADGTFTLSYGLNVVDLTSAVDSAAFYRGAVGMNGPSIHSIDITGHTTTFYVEGSFVVSEEDIRNFILSTIYVQVNTANWLSGEIRAQAVLPSDWIAYYLSTLDDDAVADLMGGDHGKSDDDKSGSDNGSGDAKAKDDDAEAKAKDDDAEAKAKDDDAKAKDDDLRRRLGAKKSKPKPVPVLIELFEESGSGWYNNSGTWSYPMSAVNQPLTAFEILPNRRRLHPKQKIDMPPRPTYVLDTSVAMFPDILMYPTYVIMTVDKTKQLHVGSLCPHRDVERCEERLPPHGEFVFRVMGKDPEGDDSWKFCGVEGVIGQELQFEMKKGACVPTSLTNAGTMCSVNTMVEIEGSLILKGVGTELTEVDSKVLENEIASMLVSTTVVAITSWHVNDDGNAVVSFEATLLAEKQGVDGKYRENVDTLVSTLQNNIKTAFASGAFLSQMESALLEYPQSDVGVSKTTSAVLTSLEITKIEYVEASTVVKQRTPVTLPVASSTSSTEESVVTAEDDPSIIFMSCVVVGVVVIAAAIALRPRKATEEFVHHELAVDSEHADSIPEFDLGLEHVANKKGLFFVSKDRF